MKDTHFLRLQVAELRELLKVAENDPVMRPQLDLRLENAERELQEVEGEPGNLFPPEPADLPRAALFLKGGGVQGAVGIRPVLAGQALIQYEGMFTEQALHEERQEAR